MDPAPPLPNHRDSRMAVRKGEATALQRFIAAYEPSDGLKLLLFQERLQAVLKEARG